MSDDVRTWIHAQYEMPPQFLKLWEANNVEQNDELMNSCSFINNEDNGEAAYFNITSSLINSLYEDDPACASSQ